MKNTIHNNLKRLPGLLASLLLLAAAACTPESLVPDNGTDSQARSAMTLEFGVSATEVGVRTRAGVDENAPLAAAFESKDVQSLWVGVFDVETGDLVGQIQTKKSNQDELIENGTAKVDILYYDAHPTVRIFGVANYVGIEGSYMPVVAAPERAKEESDKLENLLNKVNTMSEFFSISVDTGSADNVQKEIGAPLMMGVYTSNTTGLVTVEADGNGKFEASSDIDVTLVDNRYDRLDYNKKLTDGAIRLRRLLSKVNVTVKGGDNIKVSNLSYKVYNLPNEVYLQERTTQDKVVDKEDWSIKTPNKADVKGADGYYNLNPKDDPIETEEGYTFQFFQYENKHWGWGLSASPIYDNREEVREVKDGMPIFTALCGNEYDYNNNASYFEITLNVVDNSKNQSGTVTYRIHEGFCNSASGNNRLPDKEDALWNENENERALDFTCVRNTEYNYTITIKGLTSLDVTAENHDQKHDSGILGGSELLVQTKSIPLVGGDEGKLDKTQVSAYVYYYENAKSPIAYGAGDSEVLEAFCKKIPSLESANWSEEPGNAPFFIIGGTEIKGLDLSSASTVSTKAGENSLTVEGAITFNGDTNYPDSFNPKNYRCELYLIESTGDDFGCKTYKYICISHQPEDKREPVCQIDFSLAFRNEKDAQVSDKNGAVAGQLREVTISPESIDCSGRPDEVDEEDLVYSVYLDDVLVIDSKNLEEVYTTNLYARNTSGYTPLSSHTVKIVVQDTQDRYSDGIFEKKFLVYPTKITWEELGTTTPEDKNYYGKAYSEYKDIDVGEFLGLQLTATYDPRDNDEYLKTGGTEKHSFDILPLYDGVIKIKASSTGNIDVKRDSDNTNSNSNSYWNDYLGRYLCVDDHITPEKQISFASFADAKEYEFYVKKGDKPIEIWTSRSLRIYSITYTYADQPKSNNHTWNFSTNNWTVIGTNVDDFAKPAIIEYDGLRIQAIESNLKFRTDGSVTSYTNYFQYSKRSQEISFVVNKPGTVSVVASATGNDPQDTRCIMVQVGEDSDSFELHTSDGGNSGKILKKSQGEAASYTIEDITEPTRVYIYINEGALNIYEIKFTEK